MRTKTDWTLISVLGVVVCLSSMTAARAAEEAKQEPIRINKIYWCIHPYCWSMYSGIPEGSDPELWNATLARELRAHELHMDLVSNMKADEALIIYPIGSSEPMTNLITHAEKTLGRRCVIMTRQTVNPDFLEDVPDPIRAFLEDDELEGKKEFVQAMLTDKGRCQAPEGLAEELEAEIREACEVIGYGWSYWALEVIYGNRVMAIDIEEQFRKQGLVYDPKTVEGMTFGEGFVGCSMTWKSMLPHYMGLAKAIENDPKLSVIGVPYMDNAEFKERIVFADDVRLLLWEGEDGRPIALFYRAADRLKNPQLYAHVPLAGLSLELWRGKEKRWSAQAETKLPAGHLYVPVYTATRTGGANTYFYLIASEISLQDFRNRLADVEISTKAD
ncbi:MAG: hypothetical protein KAW89_01270 [Armatimonadetes bacterium]|nr:hypothetical protein [Armatimonadota bacterium]